MRIVIIGAGAMGSLFGSRLSEADVPVCLVDIWAEHIRCIQTEGLVVEEGSDSRRSYPRAVTDPAEAGPADLIIVFVKSGATRLAAESLKGLLQPHTRVMTLQNGLGNAETLAEILGAERILAGTTAQGATMLGPGRVRHAGCGDTHIGRFAGAADEITRNVAAILNGAGLRTIVEEDVQALIWGKLIVNVGINAVTALLGLRNGQVAEIGEVAEVSALAVNEAVLVAAAAGITLPYNDPVQKVLDVARATAQNQSSMLQDIRNRRVTEVEAINGAVVRAGQKWGVPTPVNQTLTLLIQAAQKNDGKL